MYVVDMVLFKASSRNVIKYAVRRMVSFLRAIGFPAMLALQIRHLCHIGQRGAHLLAA